MKKILKFILKIAGLFVFITAIFFGQYYTVKKIYSKGYEDGVKDAKRTCITSIRKGLKRMLKKEGLLCETI